MTTNENAPDPLNPFQRDTDEIEVRIGSLTDPKVKAIANAHVAKMLAVSTQQDRN